MSKKHYFFKFLIKYDRELKQFEIKAIKDLIFEYLGDITKENIRGGITNNVGYYKFRSEKKD